MDPPPLINTDYDDDGTITPTSPSPETSSILTNSNASLFQTSKTLDDITRVLSSFSRGLSPEPTSPLVCCCGRTDCEATLSWLDTRSRLEKNLELSAEVGQAMLERHEAYVRRSEKQMSTAETDKARAHERITSLEDSNQGLIARLASSVRESGDYEKRLSQIELNLQVADASNRALIKQLEESRSANSRLNMLNTRSTGWEARLDRLAQERDDLLQEKEAERVRAKTAEAKLIIVEDKCSELTSDVIRLREEVEEAHVSRVEFSAAVAEDARVRLEGLQDSLGLNHGENSDEITRLLESLVADNEAIKRDNAELQNMLAESREDLKLAREELMEQQSLQSVPQQPPAAETTLAQSNIGTEKSLKLNTAHNRHRSHGRGSGWTPTGALITSRGHRPSDSTLTNSSAPMSPYSRHSPSPMYPSNLMGGYPWSRRASHETHRRSRSTDAGSGTHGLSSAQRSPAARSTGAPSLANSSISVDHGDDLPRTPDPNDLDSEYFQRPRPLMLLSRSRGVQTEEAPTSYVLPMSSPPIRNGFRHQGALSRQLHSSKPSSIGEPFTSSTQKKSTNSETSSFDMNLPTSESVSSNPDAASTLPTFISRVAAIHTRITQADVRTLSNRLKRQHIVGGDVGHLSKSTLKTIQVEINTLRSYFKIALDTATVGLLDEAPFNDTYSLVARNDLRGLLKLAKDLLTELAQLRSVVNTVTLDPSVAVKLKEQSLSDEDPSRDNSGEVERGRTMSLKPQTAIGWFANPIQKFFAPVTPPTIDISDADADRKRSGSVTASSVLPSRPLRPAPKLAPAVSASTTTVNVEFASTGSRGATVAAGTDLLGLSPGRGPSRPGLLHTGSLGRSSGAQVSADLASSNDSRSRNLLGIFAGAPLPAPSSSGPDPWVVIPKRNSSREHLGLRSGDSSVSASLSQARLGFDGPGFNNHRRLGLGNGPRPSASFNPNRLSRIVDAVIDDPDNVAPSQPGRTLRSKGLSDSSLHESFMQAAPVNRLITPSGLALSSTSDDASDAAMGFGSSFTRESVLQTLSRTVQSFRNPQGSITPTYQPTRITQPPLGTLDGAFSPSSSDVSGPGSTLASYPSATPPARAIQRTHSRSRVNRSSSRSGPKREVSYGPARPAGPTAIPSRVGGDSLGSTPISSIRDESPLNSKAGIRRESRGALEFD